MTFYPDGHFTGGGAYALAGSSGSGSGNVDGAAYAIAGSSGSGSGNAGGAYGVAGSSGSGSGSSQSDSYSAASALNAHQVMASDSGSEFEACDGATLIHDSMQGNDYSNVDGVKSVTFKEKTNCPAIVASKAAVVIVVVPLQRANISAKGKRESLRILQEHFWAHGCFFRQDRMNDFALLVDLPR